MRCAACLWSEKMKVQSFLAAVPLLLDAICTADAACTNNVRLIKLFNRSSFAVVGFYYSYSANNLNYADWKSPDLLLDRSPMGKDGPAELRLKGSGPIKIRVDFADRSQLYGDVKELCSLIHIVISQPAGRPRLEIAQ